jgi:two-component system, NtrC family, response regulator HydG
MGELAENDDLPTQPDASSSYLRSLRGAENTPCLVIACAPAEPWRIGEFAEISPAAELDEPLVLGRGNGSHEPPTRRLVWVRWRPDAQQVTGALSTPTLSRRQLLIRRARNRAALEVENIGRCILFRNGVATSATEVEAGDTLQLGSQLLLLCSSRPPHTRPFDYPPFRFGHADPFGMVGESNAIWELRRELAFVASRQGHVLLRGESGTGKELAARAIHELSDRSSRPFVARDATTLPEALIDAELFGNRRNYPNLGMPERPGLIGEADGSTLFLDEIGELPPALQAHLLRVLDHGEYQRLGESTSRHSNFRLVAATNRPDSALKPELFARFPFRIELPAIEARRSDIPLLVDHLIRQIGTSELGLERKDGRLNEGLHSRFSIELMNQLLHHSYGTNLRELKALLWQAIMNAPDGRLDPLPKLRFLETVALRVDTVFPHAARPTTGGGALSRERIVQALDECNGVIEAAWRALGMKNRHALTRWIKRHGIEVTRRRNPRPPRSRSRAREAQR